MRIRAEDEADSWLKSHDPYYTSRNGWKAQAEERPYETPGMERRRREVEIPFSNLSKRQKQHIPEAVSFHGEGI